MRALWFITGFLTGVIVTALGMLWLLAEAMLSGA